MTDPVHARGLGRASRLAAGSRLHAARSPMAASPRCRSCPARPICSAAARSPCKNVPARTMQGMKFPGAPRRPQDGLRRESQARLRRPQPDARDADGQYRASIRQTWLDARRICASGEPANATPRATSPWTRCAGRARRRDPGPEPLLPRRRDGDHARYGQGVRLPASPASTTRSRAYKIADLLRESGICAAMWADW